MGFLDWKYWSFFFLKDACFEFDEMIKPRDPHYLVIWKPDYRQA